MIPFCPFLPSSICPYISRQSGIKIPTFSRSLALKCSIDLREKKKKNHQKQKESVSVQCGKSMVADFLKIVRDGNNDRRMDQFSPQVVDTEIFFQRR